METIKSIIGLGSTQQEGREPVNGVTGSGVGGEPYDQGNVEGVLSFAVNDMHEQTLTVSRTYSWWKGCSAHR
jgi:hypothetical protein